jgi:hypothetical protein
MPVQHIEYFALYLYCFNSISPLPIQASPEEKCNPCQTEQHRNLHERPNSRGKRLIGTDAIYGDSDRYRQLLTGKIILINGYTD